MPIIDLVRKFNKGYYNHLNLVASENLSSANVREALSSDLHHRYAIPPRGQRDAAIWEYPRQDEIRKIVADTEQLGCKLFHAAKADVSPLSGNQIAEIMLSSLLKPGDTFLSVGSREGGHFTTQKIADDRGYKRFDLPYDNDKGVIDVERTVDLVKRTSPKLVFLDASMILFPYPVKELRKALGDDIIISYDASHTLGLIAGGAFQSPLLEGADFIHGSTHKSLWGPQKGIILSAKSLDESEAAKKVFSRIVPLFASNVHPHHIAALGIALEESLNYGESFARDTISNSRLLGRSLSENGLRVAFAERGYTNCHQVILPIGDKPEAMDAFRRLESTGINVNMTGVPFSAQGESGLRLGTNELTRRGIGGAPMKEIADLIASVIQEKRILEKRKV